MNFFKKLFAGKEKKLRSRAARIPSNFLNNISLLVDIEDKPRRFPLQNISETGLSVSCPGNTNLFPKDEVLEAEVTAKGRSVFFVAEVVRHSADNVGLKVTKNGREFKNFVQNYFREEIALLKFSRVNADKLKPDPDGTPVWYQGDDNCEFYYVLDQAGELAKFQLTLFGNVIERDTQGRVHTLMSWEDEDGEEGDMAVKGSTLLRRGALQSAEDLIPLTHKFLSLMNDLPAQIKSEVESAVASLKTPKE